jgi:hypothetical protein
MMPQSLSFCVIILSSSSYGPHTPYNKEEVTCIRGYSREPISEVPTLSAADGESEKRGYYNKYIFTGLHILEKV